MSFEVYVQSFRNGEPSGVPRGKIRSAFGGYLTETEPNFWHLRYDDANSCDLNLTVDDADPGVIQGFAVHRPCGDARLWDALAAILSLGDLVLYFPGGGAPLVARTSVAQHLPMDMVEALGQPVVVTRGEQIQNEIQRA
jgi:hypothetical protein